MKLKFLSAISIAGTILASASHAQAATLGGTLNPIDPVTGLPVVNLVGYSQPTFGPEYVPSQLVNSVDTSSAQNTNPTLLTPLYEAKTYVAVPQSETNGKTVFTDVMQATKTSADTCAQNIQSCASNPSGAIGNIFTSMSQAAISNINQQIDQQKQAAQATLQKAIEDNPTYKKVMATINNVLGLFGGTANKPVPPSAGAIAISSPVSPDKIAAAIVLERQAIVGRASQDITNGIYTPGGISSTYGTAQIVASSVTSANGRALASAEANAVESAKQNTQDNANADYDNSLDALTAVLDNQAQAAVTATHLNSNLSRMALLQGKNLEVMAELQKDTAEDGYQKAKQAHIEAINAQQGANSREFVTTLLWGGSIK